jgi:hypothetical protein
MIFIINPTHFGFDLIYMPKVNGVPINSLRDASGPCSPMNFAAHSVISFIARRT